MPTKKINRSSKTGKIVTKEFADKNPDTTQKETVVVSTISPLGIRFNQEDLNKMADKIEEIIRRLNNVL